MDNDIPEINELIKQFSKLPGLGPKSAKRIILKLINNKDNMVKPLAKSLDFHNQYISQLFYKLELKI